MARASTRSDLLIVFAAIAVAVTAFAIWSMMLRAGSGLAESESAFRARLESGDLLAVMTTGARPVLKGGQSLELTREQWQTLREAGMQFTDTVEGAGGAIGVLFVFGSADRHYGVLVMNGPPPPSLQGRIRQWTSGVWYYSEVPLPS